MFILEQTVNAKHPLYTLKATLRNRVSATGYMMHFGELSADVEITTAYPAIYHAMAKRLKERARRGGLRFQMKRCNISALANRLNSCQIVTGSKPSSAVVSPISQPALLTSTAQVKQIYCQDGESKPQSPGCVPDAPEGLATAGLATHAGLSPDAGHEATQAWLASHRLPHHAAIFADFCAADLLRLSRDDLIQICGLADGIRLFNALHSKRIEPRLTVYVCADASGVYTAIYLHACTAGELVSKLQQMMPRNDSMDYGNEPVLMSGPSGARVYLTDDVVRHMHDNANFRLGFCSPAHPH